MKKFYAIKGINEDSFGYDFINYNWRGAVETSPGHYQTTILEGEEGVAAHQDAIKNRILLPEDGVTTGDIAIAPGVSPAMGTEPAKAKKKRKKGDQVIVGDEQK